MDGLIGMHCQIGQGYFFSRPMSAKKINHWLNSWYKNKTVALVK